jgi:hypothetical protein
MGKVCQSFGMRLLYLETVEDWNCVFNAIQNLGLMKFVLILARYFLFCSTLKLVANKCVYWSCY